MAVILVQVVRSPGDRVAEDIVDPLLTTEAVAVERGRVFIDNSYQHKIAVSGSGPFSEWMPPGSLIDVLGFSSPSYTAQLMGCEISITRNEDEITSDINMKMERLYDDQ